MSSWKNWFTAQSPIEHRDGSVAQSRKPRSAHLHVEQLEDRTVPTATIVDLTTAGASGAIGQAVFEQASLKPGGTGALHSFVRLQAHGHATVEQGYNSSIRPVQFDEKKDRHSDRAIQLNEFETVTINGTTYRAFILDINQKHSSPKLSLDELRVYVSDSSTLTGYDPTAGTLGGVAPIYDMNALVAGVEPGNSVTLNAALSHGSGSTDMVLFLPDSLFTSATGVTSTNPYVYLYSKFGVNFAANAGFEEWAPGKGKIPLPATLGGFVYQDKNTNSTFDTGDAGVAGIVLTLTGTNNLGQTVTMTTTSAADGSYFFVGFQPGTYTITESPPPSNFTEEVSNVGTVNGVADGNNPTVDTLTSIILATGQSGINYNFGLI